MIGMELMREPGFVIMVGIGERENDQGLHAFASCVLALESRVNLKKWGLVFQGANGGIECEETPIM